MSSSEKRLAARTVRCPRCGAQPYSSCERSATTKVVFLKNPHVERIDEAASSGRLATEDGPL